MKLFIFCIKFYLINRFIHIVLCNVGIIVRKTIYIIGFFILQTYKCIGLHNLYFEFLNYNFLAIDTLMYSNIFANIV